MNISNTKRPKRIKLIGDITAGTGNLEDILEYNNEDDSEELNTVHYLERANAATQRSNTDTLTNSYGPKLIQFCKTMNLVIINGRCGKDKNIEKPTFKDVSAVNYTITSPELLRHIDNFEIKDFDPLLSDVHCAIHTKLFFMLKLN